MHSATLTVYEVLAPAQSDDTMFLPDNMKEKTTSVEKANTVMPDADPTPRTLSLAELKELIEQGKTDQIPNNKIIPNDLSVCLNK
jgi:hypothetical protein